MVAQAEAGLILVERVGEAARDEGSGAECEALIAGRPYALSRSADGI